MDDYDGQMLFGDLVGLKLPDIRLAGEEKPRKNLTQETCPDRESNPAPLPAKRACYHLLHSGGQIHKLYLGIDTGVEMSSEVPHHFHGRSWCNLLDFFPNRRLQLNQITWTMFVYSFQIAPKKEIARRKIG